MVGSTIAIESVNARIRRALKARDPFPNEQAVVSSTRVTPLV
ncbi:transposase [Amycolatopsis sp. EV170708-02-1]|nr:transposase [Amycolatopsis sp. EV170708-02-1]UMP06743.1 transposase [Amycolatopsis sp. EV170708-02-1]